MRRTVDTNQTERNAPAESYALAYALPLMLAELQREASNNHIEQSRVAHL